MKRTILSLVIALTVALGAIAPALPGNNTNALAQQNDVIERNFAGVSFTQPYELGSVLWGYSPGTPWAHPGAPTRTDYPDYAFFHFFKGPRGDMHVYPVDNYEVFDPAVKEPLDGLKKLLEAKGEGDVPPLPRSALDFLYLSQQAISQPVMREKLSYISMRNGSGVRFISGYAEPGQPLTDRSLYYVYLGLSLDGLHYVEAMFELLQPSSYFPKPPNPGSPNYAAEVQAYNQAVADKIRSTPDSNFNTSLDQFDTLFKTMQVGRHTFKETGKTIQGRFFQYWNRNGGLPQQGFAITEEMQEKSDTDGKTYTMQYFERAVFEYHPENKPPFDVLLSLLGTFYYTEKYNGNAPGQKASTDNPRTFPETGKTVGGAFRYYWETRGGLAQQGYPISNEFEEVSQTDGKKYIVQYFQRGVFEYHPDLEASGNQVLLSLLGTFYYNKKHGGN